MSSTQLGNEFEQQFSVYTEMFVIFLQIQYLNIARQYMDGTDMRNNIGLLKNMWALKQRYEPVYWRSYNSFLSRSRLAETGTDQIIEIVPKTLEYNNFSASIMKNGPQSLAKKAFLRGIPVDQLLPIEIEQSFANVAQVAAQKTLEAPRENAMEIIKKDKKALGYVRVIDGGACDFCSMIAGRGPVFSKNAVKFDAHRSCKCYGRAAYEGYKNSSLQQDRIDKWLEKNKGKYNKSQKESSYKDQVKAGIRKKETENYLDREGKQQTRISYVLTEKGKKMEVADRILDSKQYKDFKYSKDSISRAPSNIDPLKKAELEAARKAFKEKYKTNNSQDFQPAIFGDY